MFLMSLQLFSDGRSIVRFTNGDVKKTFPENGTVVYYYAERHTTQTTYKSGLEVFEFPNGQVSTSPPYLSAT